MYKKGLNLLSCFVRQSRQVHLPLTCIKENGYIVRYYFKTIIIFLQSTSTFPYLQMITDDYMVGMPFYLFFPIVTNIFRIC